MDGMDVLDAGVYVAKFEATVPKHATMAMWGPLQAKEMGLDGWEVQDGGETGFILHHQRALRLGRGMATLIFVRRIERAFLSIYMGGYPADAKLEQRRLDQMEIVHGCERYLGRLAKEAVSFRFQGEMILVDNSGGGQVIDAEAKTLGAGRRLKGGRDAAMPPGNVVGVDMVGGKDKKKGTTWEV